MKKPVMIFVIAIVLLISMGLPVFAANGQPPVGSCPPGFEIHEFGHHLGDQHHHFGITKDLNGDGLICVKHLDNGLHVHVDNVIR